METVNEKPCARLMEAEETTPPDSGSSVLPEDAATPDGSPLHESEAGKPWEERLNTCKQRIEDLQESYEQSYLEIGKVLIQARDIYKGHGDWINWLKENVPFSVRHAQRLIRVAEMFDDATLVSQLGLTSSKAYILTRVGKDDIRQFPNISFPVGSGSKFVKKMTRRELESVVTKFLKDKLTQTDQEGGTSNQDDAPLKEDVESNLQELERILKKTISSIAGSTSEKRDLWISELEALYKAGVDQLTSESE